MTDTLKRKFKAQDARITWQGSESNSSLVLGAGRPFHAELIKPKIRKCTDSTLRGRSGVTIQNLSVLSHPPAGVTRSTATVRIQAAFASDIPPSKTAELSQQLQDATVSFYSVNKRKLVERTIHKAQVEKASRRRIQLLIECDSGLVINAFVDGGDPHTGNIGYVQPTLSSILDTQAKCLRFDILDVK